MTSFGECEGHTKADRTAALLWATRIAVAACIDERRPHDADSGGHPD